METIGQYAFYNDAPYSAYTTNLIVLMIEGAVKKIESYAFCNQTVLGNISLPSTITTIGEYAFLSCQALREITIPEGLVSLSSKAYLNCPYIKTIIAKSANGANELSWTGADLKT